MTKLQWDKTGEKLFESDVEKVVLYPENKPGIAWNGFVSIEEDKSTIENQELYIDGFNYLNTASSHDYRCNISVFTYPEELDNIDTYALGDYVNMSVTNQSFYMFGLSYKTKIGTDLEQDNFNYKIHLVYNLSLAPSSYTNTTKSNITSPINFTFTGYAKPIFIGGFQHTAHLIIDSRKNSKENMAILENALYGTEDSDPFLPSVSQLSDLFST